MSSRNLAICIAPSLLWPDSGLDVIKNEVPPLIQFMVEHSPNIWPEGLPELYLQAELTTTPREEFMMARPEAYHVPTKKNDGGLRVNRHKRTSSMDTSTSEDSAGEDDLPSNLLHMQHSGLTFSDSQISVISQQLEDEEYVSPRRSRKSEVPLRIGQAGFQIPAEALTPKRYKKTRHLVERSSSYRGPNERQPHGLRYRISQDDAARRKSIATQTTLQRGTQLMSPPLVHIPPSPNTSASSSSHSQDVSPFLKSHKMQSFDENEEFLGHEEMEVGRPIQSLAWDKRRAFHPRKSETRQGRVPKPSYYDHLSPLSPNESLSSRNRSRSMNTALSTTRGSSFDSAMDEDEGVGEGWATSSLSSMAPPLRTSHLTSSDSGKPPPVPPHASNQSITSRSSTSSGGHYYQPSPHVPLGHPSILSLVSSMSESSMGSVPVRGSPELERRPSLNREIIKSEISKRFNIPSRGELFAGATLSYTGSGGASKKDYTPDQQRKGHSDSFNKELDKLQRKFQERRRPEERQRMTSTTSSGTGIGSPHSFDDRPESEQHLNSLPRPTTTEFIQPPPQVIKVANYRQPSQREEQEKTEQDSNKLFPEYNSDTESSPSRTLTRPDKLWEVANNSLSKGGMAGRYRGSRQAMKQYIRMGQTTLGVAGKQVNVPAKKASMLPPEEEKEACILDTSKPSAQPKSETIEQKRPEQAEPAVSMRASAMRPKSAEGVSKRNSADFEPRQRTMSDIEIAKLKLGLIPPRRRSRSISDTKQGQPDLQGDKEAEEKEDREERTAGAAAGTSSETERVDKRGRWLSHAPTSSDRKEAWVQRIRGGTITEAPQRRSRQGTPSGALPLQRVSTAPEMKRRATTMPEYLVTRTAAMSRPGRMLGHGLVRTVKITSYNVPEPRKIHRINVRTHH